MADNPECCRKDKILDAAENAFADSGFDGASLRRIVLEAQVNLATVYYYFGSKDGLMEAVFKRRFAPLKQEQLDMLRQLEAEAPQQALSIEKILEALLLPSLKWMVSGSPQKQLAMRLIGRIVTEPNLQAQELLRCQHSEVRLAFVEAFQRALPALPREDLLWRMEFVWGSLAFVLCNPGRVGAHTDGVCNPSDSAKVLPQMIAFFSAGLRAPVTDTYPVSLNENLSDLIDFPKI